MEPPGFLDILVETEEAMPIMVETISAIGEVIAHLGNLAERGTAELDEAEAQGHNTQRILPHHRCEGGGIIRGARWRA